MILATAALAGLAAVATGQADTGLPEGKENTVVIVQNAGNADADVNLDIYTPAGVAVGSASRQARGIAPGGTAQFPQAVNEGLVEGFRGVGVLSSDEPINALLVRDILRSASTEAKSYSLANATAEGGHKLAAPFMFNELAPDGRSWNSRASVVNVGTADACVRTTYTLMPGTGGSTGDSSQTVVHPNSGEGDCSSNEFLLEAGAQLTFSPEPGDTVYPGNTQDNQMAAVFEVTNPSDDNRISAVVDVYRSDGNRLLGSYNALVQEGDDAPGDDVGTRVIAPIAMKSTSGFYTVTGVVNLSDADADAEIEFIGNLSDGTGAAFSHTEDLGTIPSDEGTFFSTYQTDDIPSGFIGYAVVTSDQPVAVNVIRGKLSDPQGDRSVDPGYASVNGVPEDQASETWRAPLYFRRYAPGAGASVGYNSWVQVQVADGGSANVTLRYVGDPASGCPTGPYELSTTVNNSKVFYANLNNSPDNGFPAGNAPNCFFGGLEVTADDPIIVISQVGADKFPGGDSEGVTNSFGE
ncbi:MAG: hypothetical protein U5Q44_04990 [Dehalococcoidia bacterium]|nr:hypothetical protein [Dehalococcoidia bacterium]